MAPPQDHMDALSGDGPPIWMDLLCAPAIWDAVRALRVRDLMQLESTCSVLRDLLRTGNQPNAWAGVAQDAAKRRSVTLPEAALQGLAVWELKRVLVALAGVDTLVEPVVIMDIDELRGLVDCGNSTSRSPGATFERRIRLLRTAIGRMIYDEEELLLAAQPSLAEPDSEDDDDDDDMLAFGTQVLLDHGGVLLEAAVGVREGEAMFEVVARDSATGGPPAATALRADVRLCDPRLGDRCVYKSVNVSLDCAGRGWAPLPALELDATTQEALTQPEGVLCVMSVRLLRQELNGRWKRANGSDVLSQEDAAAIQQVRTLNALSLSSSVVPL